MTDGRGFRILAIVDDCSRECLALVADTSLPGVRVARELDRLLAERGRPKMIVSDRRGSGNDPVDRLPEEGQRADVQRHPGLG
jgi:transposase InsO family protein